MKKSLIAILLIAPLVLTGCWPDKKECDRLEKSVEWHEEEVRKAQKPCDEIEADYNSKVSAGEPIAVTDKIVDRHLECLKKVDKKKFALEDIENITSRCWEDLKKVEQSK